MSENRQEIVEMSIPEPTTPANTKKETRNTRRGNRKGNVRCGNKGGVSWSGQKDFKGETPKINAVLDLINKRLDQGVTVNKFQDILKNYALTNFRKAEDIVETITDLKDPVTNFDTKHMPDDQT